MGVVAITRAFFQVSTSNSLHRRHRRPGIAINNGDEPYAMVQIGGYEV